MREIAVVTVARSDFGIYLPLLKAIRANPDLRLRILVSGTHLSPEFGLTVREIEEAGLEIFERIESLIASDTPAAIAKSIGLGVLGFAQLFSRYKPDILWSSETGSICYRLQSQLFRFEFQLLTFMAVK